MVSVLASSGIDRRFELWSSRTKDYAIGIYCFPTKHAHYGVRVKTVLLVISIMCPSGAACLPVELFY